MTARTVRVCAVLVAVGFVVAAVGVASARDPRADGDRPEPGPFAKPTEQTTYGWILVPTEPPARVFSPMSARGLMHFYIDATADAPFALDPRDANTARLCAPIVCVETSDFDIVFFKEDSKGAARAVAGHEKLGNETGRVPSDAAFALVFLRTPGLVPTAKGYGFVYREGQPGSDTLPKL